MNAAMKCAALGLCICSLGACAGSQDKTTYAPGTRVVPSARTVDPYTQDDAYMARVENMARARGITVLWINPPTRHNRDVASQ